MGMGVTGGGVRFRQVMRELQRWDATLVEVGVVEFHVP